MDPKPPPGREPVAESNAPAEKWEANRAKVAYAERFPGRLAEWSATRGKTVEAVVPFDGGSVVIFHDGTFLIATPSSPGPAAIMAALAAARDRLGRRYAEAFATLDQLTARDRELTRRAKLDRILGAIRHNAAEIPELKEAVQRLLDHWDGRLSSHAEKD